MKEYPTGSTLAQDRLVKNENAIPFGKRKCGFEKSDERLSRINVAIDGSATEGLGYQWSVVEQTKNDAYRVLTVAEPLLVS
jgi:hypothetical protein